MRFKGLVAVMLGALASAGVAPAVAQDERGIDPNQGRSLMEVTLDSKASAMRLQLEADTYGIEFNEHYLRRNGDGTVTATVFGFEDELQALESAGYDLGATIEGPATWREHTQEYLQEVRQEERAADAALTDVGTQSHDDEVVILRADYFENYAGRFLSVEAKTRLGGAAPTGSTYVGPALSLSFNRGGSTPIDSLPRVMSTNIDPDTTPDTYIEHRELVRIGDAGTTDPPRPSRIRVGSSTGEAAEATVETWLGGGLPPMKTGFIRDFSTKYMDPTEIYAAFEELADEYPNLTELITLPNKTNGYQRRAQATMAGTTLPGNTPQEGNAAATRLFQSSAIVLTSRAWGHEGGNDISAEFRDPGVPSSPLTVTVTGGHVDVLLATDATGARTSTGQQVVDAINANAAASQILVANVFTRITSAAAHSADRPGHRHRAAAGARAPVGLPDNDHERPRPARAVRVLRAADQQEEPQARQVVGPWPQARREGRRLPLLPAARP